MGVVTQLDTHPVRVRARELISPGAGIALLESQIWSGDLGLLTWTPVVSDRRLYLPISLGRPRDGPAPSSSDMDVSDLAGAARCSSQLRIVPVTRTGTIIEH